MQNVLTCIILKVCNKAVDSIALICYTVDTVVKKHCLGGVMVATLVLEASVERRASSSLAPGTILKHIEVGK